VGGGSIMKELRMLLQVKKLIALGLTVVFMIMTLKGAIDTQSFMTVFLLVIGAYFGQSIANNSSK